MLKILLVSILLGLPYAVDAQIFAPFSFWRTKKDLTTRCVSGCWPTPTTPFTASTYYVPVNTTVQFSIVSASNPTGASFCWGPTAGGGCTATPTYPLACASGASSEIDGSIGTTTDAYYTATAAISDTCYVTDFAESRTQSSVVIQSFTPVIISSPVTSSASPRNVCINQTQAITGSGGIAASLDWTVAVGTGSVSPLTGPKAGTTTTYTAPSLASTVEVRLTDATTGMYDTAFINVVSAITLSPTATTIETPVNSNTSMRDAAGAASLYVANLTFSGNCGLANYTATCTGGGAVVPSSGIAANAAVQFKPASQDSTLTVKFTDSNTPAASTDRTVKMVVPADIVNGWGSHFCVKYSHSSYTAGTFKLKCFGYNNAGQLGYGNTTTKGIAATDIGFGLLFVKNTGTTGADMVIKDVSVGIAHTCAILSDDTVKCWGNNTYGQLGYSNTTALTSPSASTVALGGGTPLKLYASAYKTCLVFSDNRLKCWGRNTNGELGQDNTTNYGSNGTDTVASMGYVSVAGAQLTVQRVAGSENNTCVLATSSFVPGPSKVYCWGFGNSGTCGFGTIPDTNYCGELGKATANADWGSGTNLMSALTAVNLGLTGSETVIDIAAGRKHICAIIAATSVSTAGTPICWGRNNIGQLGIDSTIAIGDNETPTTRITSMTTATRLEMGTTISCAILTGSTAKCWGEGTYGQLLGSSNVGGPTNYTTNIGDDGAPAMSALVAMELGTGLTVKKLAVGNISSCAILSNDFVKCWGAQYCGIGNQTKKNNGCTFSGTAGTLSNTDRYIGDVGGEVGNSLLYLSH